MKVKLYLNKSSNNTLKKNVELIETINVNFKSDLDISNPEIKLLLDGLDFKVINYVEIVDLNRFYFISRFTKINNRMGIIYLECDLLTSFKDDVLKSNALYMRSIKNGDFVNIQETSKYTSTVKKVESNYEYSEGSTMILTSVRGV